MNFARSAPNPSSSALPPRSGYASASSFAASSEDISRAQQAVHRQHDMITSLSGNVLFQGLRYGISRDSCDSCRPNSVHLLYLEHPLQQPFFGLILAKDLFQPSHIHVRTTQTTRVNLIRLSWGVLLTSLNGHDLLLSPED